MARPITKDIYVLARSSFNDGNNEELENVGDYEATIEHTIRNLTERWFAPFFINIPKQHPLDAHYPHKCHKCHRQLHFKELFDRNISEVLKYYFENTSKCKTKWDFRGCYNREYKMYKHLKRLWKSKVVQFYCCYCYDSRKVQKIHFAP